MAERIKAIRMRPDEEPEEIQIENELRALQAEVGGYIETIPLGEGVVAVVNEEGWLEQLEPNCLLRGSLIVGPVLLLGENGEEFGNIPEGCEELWLDALLWARERALPQPYDERLADWNDREQAREKEAAKIAAENYERSKR